jgi:phasin family protein
MANPRQEDRSTQSMEDARRAGERTAEQTARIRQTAVEQTRRVGEAAAEAGEEVARASAHLLKQNAETLQDVLRFGLDMTTAVMGRSTDQLGHTLGLSGDEAQEAAERSARNAQTILYSTTAAATAMSGMSRECFELVRHQIENSMNHMKELWHCRTAQDIAAVQSDLLRDAVGTVVESNRRMADMSLRVTDDVAKRMAQDMAQDMDRMQPAA